MRREGHAIGKEQGGIKSVTPLLRQHAGGGEEFFLGRHKSESGLGWLVPVAHSHKVDLTCNVDSWDLSIDKTICARERSSGSFPSTPPHSPRTIG